MIYLLDTNALSDLMAGHPKFNARLKHLAPTDQVVTCTIVVGEIFYGIERLPDGRRRRELQAKIAILLTAVPCVALSVRVADHYGIIKAEQQRKGLSLDENDLWIAATTALMGATLVTRDTDLRQIEALAVEDWSF